MFFLFSRVTTWLFIEIIAILILSILNMFIPILMIFTSYRSLANFYFSSTALSSSLINFLYLFHLIQAIQSKTLSEINCRAFYYFQTSCIVVLAYTVVAMHASLVLCLFPSPARSREHRRCSQSCALCLRRFFHRFCCCFILCIWCISFTSTIPLLYTIDANEKSPKPVYCPGTTKITYLEEWFDRNRFMQTIIFNLIPLLMSIVLSFIALAKLFYDCLIYFYFRVRASQCCLSRRSSSTSTVTIQSCRRWFTSSFLRFTLVLSCCLLACIYPIVMRFYLIYFSVLVPLIFAVFNYSLALTQRPITSENQTTSTFNQILQTNKSPTEQFELRSPSISNLLHKQEELSVSPSCTSTVCSTPHQDHRSSKRNKQNYFANHLYENTQNMCLR